MAVRDMMCSTVGSGPRGDPTPSGADEGSRSGGDEESTARECGAAGADLVLLCVCVCVCVSEEKERQCMDSGARFLFLHLWAMGAAPAGTLSNSGSIY